jgi:DUF1680 family protein
VNGENEPLVMKNGYAVISRKWKKGDIVSVELPIEEKQVIAK